MTPAVSARAAVTVRPARDDDVAAIARIYAHYVTTGLASFEEAVPGPPELARRREAVLAAGLPYIVAELEGAVRGYAYAARYRDRSAYRYAVEDSVYVDERWGRRGIGGALLEALIDRCAALGKRQMVAVIGDSANIPSIALHAGHGFRVSGTLPSIGFKQGRWVDVVIMTRSLGDGDATLPDV